MIKFTMPNPWDVILPMIGAMGAFVMLFGILRIIGVVLGRTFPFLTFLEPTKFGHMLIGACANKEIANGDYDEWRNTARGEQVVRQFQVGTVCVFFAPLLLSSFFMLF